MAIDKRDTHRIDNLVGLGKLSVGRLRALTRISYQLSKRQ